MADIKTEFEVIIAGKDLNDLMDKFKLVNDSHYMLFRNKNQRGALERLCVKWGYDKIGKAIEIVAQTNSIPYAPQINTPYELEAKWTKWVNFVRGQQIKARSEKKQIISST